MIKTVEILFSGKVQKVGFRACLRNTGQNLGLNGEVENLSDGRVRALITGDDVLIDKFLSLTYSCPRAIIKNISVADYVPTEFTEFTVKREYQ
ncbi:MAG: acylphosphatase [Methanocorpusculum sp.]|nr:acylphosphatase [Methanocorpusculum sp.]